MNNETDRNVAHFARCSLGRDRWYWVVYENWLAMCNRQVHASGIAPSAEAAEQQARSICLGDLGCCDPCQDGTGQARYAYRHEQIKRRASKRSDATAASAPEYVYHYSEYYSEGTIYSHPYRIIKKTPKRVLVEEETWKYEEGSQTYYDVRTITLDRQELEEKGRVYCRKVHDYFYAKPYVKERTVVAILGERVEATEEAVKAAYRRLAQIHHPDHGGKAEDFKQLQTEYEAALKRCG